MGNPCGQFTKTCHLFRLYKLCLGFFQFIQGVFYFFLLHLHFFGFFPNLFCCYGYLMLSYPVLINNSLVLPPEEQKDGSDDQNTIRYKHPPRSPPWRKNCKTVANRLAPYSFRALCFYLKSVSALSNISKVYIGVAVHGRPLFIISVKEVFVVN